MEQNKNNSDFIKHFEFNDGQYLTVYKDRIETMCRIDTKQTDSRIVLDRTLISEINEIVITYPPIKLFGYSILQINRIGNRIIKIGGIKESVTKEIKGLIDQCSYLVKQESIQLEKQQLEKQQLLNKSIEEQNRKLKIEIDRVSKEFKVTEIDSYNKLLTVNETKISNINPDYLLKFVKVRSFLNLKKESVNYIFKSITSISKPNEFRDFLDKLHEQNNTLNQILLFSLNMLSSLVNGKMIMFYSIYEKFDDFGVFNSKWENDIKHQLSDLNTNVILLIDRISDLESMISSELQNLSLDISSSIKDLEDTVSSELQEVNSSLNYSNLINTVNTYINYRINKKLK